MEYSQIKKLIQSKEGMIKRQMEELSRLYNVDIKEYRQFNKIFIDSVFTLIKLKYNVIKVIAHGSEKEISKIDYNNTVKIDNDITNFISKMVEKFNNKSEKIFKYRQNKNNELDKNGVLNKEDSYEYKICQQIIDDYMKLMLEINYLKPTTYSLSDEDYI